MGQGTASTQRVEDKLVSQTVAADRPSPQPAIDPETGDTLEKSNYVRLQRTLRVDQMFWFPRFQPPLGENSLAVVLDDNYGNLCGRLAAYYTRILYLHPDEAYLQQARDNLAELGVDNVECVHLDLQRLAAGGDLPIAAGSADALFVLRPAQILREDDASQRADQLLARLLECLAADATLLLADNNSRNFRKGFGLRAHSGIFAQQASLTQCRGTLARAGFEREEYVMRAGFTRDFTPAPAWVLRDCVHDAEPIKEALPARLQQRLLSTHAMTRFWPSYAIFAQRGEVAERQFDTFVADEKLRVCCRWEKHEKLQIKRLIAGNPGVTVMLAGVVGDLNRDVVIRLPRSEAGHDSASANAKALRQLASSSLRDYAPALLASGEWRGHEYFVEEKKPGREIGYSGPRADAVTLRACRDFATLQARGARRAMIDDDGYQQVIGRYIDGLAKFCPGEAGLLLARIDNALRARFLNRQLPLVRKHGDFKLGNLLFDQHGELCALIDWDGSVALGLPLADFFTLATYNHKEENSTINFLSLNREVSVAWEVRDFYDRLLRELGQILAVDEDLMLPLRCASCLIGLQLRLDWAVKSHGSWADELANLVLRDMCALLESDSRAG